MGGPKKLAYRVAVPNDDGDLTWYGPEDDVPASVAKRITNPSAWGEGDDYAAADPAAAVAAAAAADPEVGADVGGAGDGDGDSDEPVKPYNKWRKADLEAEVASRNEGRAEEDLIEVGGNGTVKDLAAALEADDVDNPDA